MASLFGILMFVVIGWITTRAIRNWHDSNLAQQQSSFKVATTLKGKS